MERFELGLGDAALDPLTKCSKVETRGEQGAAPNSSGGDVGSVFMAFLALLMGELCVRLHWLSSIFWSQRQALLLEIPACAAKSRLRVVFH